MNIAIKQLPTYIIFPRFYVWNAQQQITSVFSKCV